MQLENNYYTNELELTFLIYFATLSLLAWQTKSAFWLYDIGESFRLLFLGIKEWFINCFDFISTPKYLLLKMSFALDFLARDFLFIFYFWNVRREDFLRIDVIIIVDVRRHKKVKLGIIHGWFNLFINQGTINITFQSSSPFQCGTVNNSVTLSFLIGFW